MARAIWNDTVLAESDDVEVEVDGEVNPAAAWCYPTPKTQAGEITGRVAFWRGVRVEA